MEAGSCHCAACLAPCCSSSATPGPRAPTATAQSRLHPSKSRWRRPGSCAPATSWCCPPPPPPRSRMGTRPAAWATLTPGRSSRRAWAAAESSSSLLHPEPAAPLGTPADAAAAWSSTTGGSTPPRRDEEQRQVELRQMCAASRISPPRRAWSTSPSLAPPQQGLAAAAEPHPHQPHSRRHGERVWGDR
jgi:hypothetical protein